MQRPSILCSLLLLSAPAVAAADSDGYYWSGKGYLAYETRWAADSATHLLHIVRFSTATGIVRSPPIHLEDFQVHGMTCRDSVVEVHGRSKAYTVDFSNPAKPSIQGVARPFDPNGASVATNLGHYAKPGVLDLSPMQPLQGFQLVISRTSRTVVGGVEHFTQTDLVWRDRSRTMDGLRGSERLFVGVRLETSH